MYSGGKGNSKEEKKKGSPAKTTRRDYWSKKQGPPCKGGKRWTDKRGDQKQTVRDKRKDKVSGGMPDPWRTIIQRKALKQKVLNVRNAREKREGFQKPGDAGGEKKKKKKKRHAPPIRLSYKRGGKGYKLTASKRKNRPEELPLWREPSGEGGEEVHQMPGGTKTRIVPLDRLDRKPLSKKRRTR